MAIKINVVRSTLAAETLALSNAVEYGIYLSEISELSFKKTKSKYQSKYKSIVNHCTIQQNQSKTF